MYFLFKRAKGSQNKPEVVVKSPYASLKQAYAAAANFVSNDRGYEYLIYTPQFKVTASEPALQWEDIR